MKWKNRKWTESSVLDLMSKCASKKEFRQASVGAYEVAVELGLIDLLPSAKTTGAPRLIDIETVVEMCRRYKSKSECQREFQYGYSVLWRAGKLNEVWPENLPTYREKDCVYIWKVVGFVDVYKVGITSVSVGRHRITDVANRAGLKWEIVVLSQVGASAAQVIESVLKRAGTKFVFEKRFNGYTEFRRISPSELAACVEIISEHTNERLL